MPQRLGRVIAERTFVVEGTRRQLKVRLGGPQRVEDDWVCPYQLSGLGRRSVRGAYGVDAFQALVLALVAIRAELASIGKPLIWFAGEAGDTGFGPIAHSFIGIEAMARIDRVIERETLRHFSRKIAARQKR